MSQSSSDSPSRFCDEGDEGVVVAEVFAQDQADLRVFRDRLPEHLRDVLAQMDAEVEEVGDDDDLRRPLADARFEHLGEGGPPSGHPAELDDPAVCRTQGFRDPLHVVVGPGGAAPVADQDHGPPSVFHPVRVISPVFRTVMQSNSCNVIRPVHLVRHGFFLASPVSAARPQRAWRTLTASGLPPRRPAVAM